MDLRSDNVNNKGIKKLMKIKMPLLRQLYIRNINVTTDVILILSKLDHNLSMFGLTLIKNLINMKICKHAVTLLQP